MIKNTIKEKNFSQAAFLYSISDSAKNGGELGWIKESSLNLKIKKNTNYSNFKGISIEGREKLGSVKPQTFGQAS